MAYVYLIVALSWLLGLLCLAVLLAPPVLWFLHRRDANFARPVRWVARIDLAFILSWFVSFFFFNLRDVRPDGVGYDLLYIVFGLLTLIAVWKMKAGEGFRGLFRNPGTGKFPFAVYLLTAAGVAVVTVVSLVSYVIVAACIILLFWLLSIGAVFLRPDEPFTWASGIKSPIYCDNRLILTAPEARDLVEHAIAETVKREYPQAQVLMGTATAGIAHAAIAAHLLGLPMGYVRSSSKDHGRQNRIEGKLVPGQKVVVVEDLISTGGSVLDAVDALREAGAEVLGVVSIFTYGMKKGVERLAAAQVRNVSLTDLDTVARAGVQEGYITEADVARLLAFRENPSDESWIRAESQV